MDVERLELAEQRLVDQLTECADDAELGVRRADRAGAG